MMARLQPIRSAVAATALACEITPRCLFPNAFRHHSFFFAFFSQMGQCDATKQGKVLLF